MGRHSAPDEDDDASPGGARTATEDVRDDAANAGRHAVTATDAATVADGTTTDATVSDGAVAGDAAGPRRRAGNADLRMLREDRTLRARCAAAVVVPFVLFTVVLIVIGRTGSYLLWLWIPTVSAGVLAGLFLDRAANARRTAEEQHSGTDGPGTTSG